MRRIGQWAIGPESWGPNENPPRKKSFLQPYPLLQPLLHLQKIFLEGYQGLEDLKNKLDFRLPFEEDNVKKFGGKSDNNFQNFSEYFRKIFTKFAMNFK